MSTKKKIGFLTFEQMHGKKNIGSSRIRARWVAKNWGNDDDSEAELYKLGEKYDVVIYQKAYFVEHARAFKGLKILDLCDPDWLDWTQRVQEMLQEVDVVTCCNGEIGKFLVNVTDKPVYIIPDRIDLSTLTEPKVHTGDLKTVVWYGYSQNFGMLDVCLPALQKRKLNLIVISDKTYTPPASITINLQNLPWSMDHWMQDIQRGDVVLNPQYKKGKWKFKSNNKTTMAWSLGLPVASNDTDLDKFLTAESRIKEVADRTNEVKSHYDVKLSVDEYKDIIKEFSK